MQLPGLPVQGLPEPLRVNIDFDAGVVDQMPAPIGSWICRQADGTIEVLPADAV
jgi:hypothetical protein